MPAELDALPLLRGGPLRRRLDRLRVRLRRRSLDQALAHGADPWAGALLMLRAGQLAAYGERRKLAIALSGLVSLAELGTPYSPYLQIRRRAVLAHRDVLLELVARLMEPEPVDVEVLAQLTLLLRDEASPVFVGGRHAGALGLVAGRCLELATGERP